MLSEALRYMQSVVAIPAIRFLYSSRYRPYLDVRDLAEPEMGDASLRTGLLAYAIGHDGCRPRSIPDAQFFRGVVWRIASRAALDLPDTARFSEAHPVKYSFTEEARSPA